MPNLSVIKDMIKLRQIKASRRVCLQRVAATGEAIHTIDLNYAPVAATEIDQTQQNLLRLRSKHLLPVALWKRFVDLHLQELEPFEKLFLAV